MEQIVQHIFANLGILPVSFVDQERSRSLLDKEFLLSRHILFKDNNSQVIKNNVYGCQFSFGQKDFRILLGDCSQNKEIPEFAVVIQLTDNPAYGLYLACDPEEMEALITVSINQTDWMPCDTFLQATLLAAMEQLKSLNLVWGKCTDFQKHYEMLVSLVSFHHSYYEVNNEGEEI